MGDDDANDLDNHVSKSAQAMARLMGMNATINDDTSGYYEVPKTLDETLREKHPALKDAYEQYQILLRFAKEEHYAQEEDVNNT